MIIGFHSIWHLENQIFFTEDNLWSKLAGDNIFYPLLALKKYAEERGVTIGKVYEFALDQIDVFVFHEVPSHDNEYFQYALHANKPMFLFNYEPKGVYEASHILSNHAPFIKVFTQHDEYIDGEKYIKINPFCLDVSPPYKNTMKTNLCTFISSNKSWYASAPNSLYYERVNAIEWFETYHPECFEFFGHDWNSEEHPCYKGTTHNKVETLAKNKFAICYENMKDVPGYITEKILDCFRAGCVPIYLGANNVTNYVPSECFIDRRNFADYDELFSFISSMSDEKYNDYLKAIKVFMDSDQGKQFSVDNFVNTMWNGLMEGLS